MMLTALCVSAFIQITAANVTVVFPCRVDKVKAFILTPPQNHLLKDLRMREMKKRNLG